MHTRGMLILFIGGLSSASVAAAENTDGIIIRFRDRTSMQAAKRQIRPMVNAAAATQAVEAAEFHVEPLMRPSLASGGPLRNTFRIRVPTGTDAARLATSLSAHRDLFEYAEADIVGTVASLGLNDPEWPQQWALHNDGQTVDRQVGVPGADINMCDAWTFHESKRPVVVAVVGTGVDAHSEFENRLLEGAAVVGDLFDSRDGCPHDTHVAGIIAAAGANSAGVAGVDDAVHILPVRVFDGCIGTASAAAAGIVWAVESGANVIVVPLAFSSSPQALMDAVTFAVDAGVPVIAPVGNDASNDVMYPAGLPDCIAVSATGNRDELASFSNFGGHVNLAAPGASIVSTWTDDGIEFDSGTSAAAAHVAGVAALLRTYAPTATTGAIRTAITNGADLIGDASMFGAGRLNALGALQQTPPPPIRFEYGETLPTQLPPGQVRPFQLSIVDVSDAMNPATATLAFRTRGGSFDSIPMIHKGGSSYQAEFPSAACDSEANFFFLATSNSGTLITDPPGAPAKFYRARVVHERLNFDDSFEEDQGWTTVAEGDVTTGAWVRDVPVETTAQPGFDRTPDAGTTCFITGQHFGGNAGTNDVDGGPVRLTSPVIPLRGDDSAVSFSCWFVTISGDEVDSLDVEASLDGGANWVVVEQIGTTDGWEDRSFRISDLATPAARQLVLRFSTSDLANDSLTEAAIDDVVVRTIHCTAASGDYNGDGVVTLDDWSAAADCWTGPGGQFSDPGCAAMDVDSDSDADLRDAQAVLNSFGGVSTS